MYVHELLRQEPLDLDLASAVARRARYAAARRTDDLVAATAQDVVIRTADPGDVLAVINLSELDSQPVPAGKLLVAEVDGKIRAALSVETGRVIADPFEPSTHLRALLRLRADQLQSAPSRRGGLLGLLAMRPHKAA
jgi:hypothetical protein